MDGGRESGYKSICTLYYFACTHTHLRIKRTIKILTSCFQLRWYLSLPPSPFFVFSFISSLLNLLIEKQNRTKNFMVGCWYHPISMCRMLCYLSQSHPRGGGHLLTREKVKRSYKLQSKPCFLTCISLVTNDYLPVSWVENTHRFSFEVNLLDLKRFLFKLLKVFLI